MRPAVLPVATLPVIHVLLDQAIDKDYKHGVLGVRARPTWDGPYEFRHNGTPVRVVACPSALAVREALLERDPDGWLVVLTDRDPDDLGAGLLAHLAWHRLRTPDPWGAVRQRFAAGSVDAALTAIAGHRDLAVGLLTATPPAGWPPAPGGVLTRDHALGAVARAHLGLDGLVDAAAALRWSIDPQAATRLADLRALAGDPLTDAVLDWVAERAGAGEAPLRRLLAAGALGEIVPLGVVAGLLVTARATDRAAGDALIRLESRLGAAARDLAALRAWGAEATALVTDLLRGMTSRGEGERLAVAADRLARELDAGAVAAGSPVLPSGLTARLTRLAAALSAAVTPLAGKPVDDRPLLAEPALDAVEAAWAEVAAHQLADDDRRVPVFHAAVRLTRWLGEDAHVGPGLADLIARHRDHDAFVDSAVNDAAPGIADPDLEAALPALGTLLEVVRRRRAAHDAAFAAALAAHTRDEPAGEPTPAGRLHRGVRHIEDLLPDVVLPLARVTPTLLLVVDGMSYAVATEVMAATLARAADGWAEAWLPGETRRAAALAALPTLTEVSRVSLLCGELRLGGQPEEQRGYAELARAAGLADAALFHRGPLDTAPPGRALAADVAATIDDPEGHPLVTCVLNTIDDALDRADPGGTDWGPVTVKHLAPLLERARRAGRVVVLTADHGHVVERRDGVARPYAGISSARSRPADPPPGDGEVLVSGRRVLRHDRRAVLAVDERLRYGPLKAGYHGGASPAEAVVPVCVLVAGVAPDDSGLEIAKPAEPAWWHGSRPRPDEAQRPDGAAPTLFDLAAPGRPPGAPPPTGDVEGVVTAVLRSRTYAAQRKIAGRVAVTDRQVAALLGALLAADDHRLPPREAAAALRVAPLALRGALALASRLLNVEGYPVLGLDPDGMTVRLDAALLREQFGVGP